MTRAECPITPAVRILREQNIKFTPHLYQYQEQGGTRVGAQELGFPEHILIKTLVMETDQHKPMLVLMHGDCEVSAKQIHFRRTLLHRAASKSIVIGRTGNARFSREL